MNRKSKPGTYEYDDDEDYVPTKKVKYSFRDDNPNPSKLKKHTLDSDEEEEDADEIAERTKYDVLKDEDIDGQEDATIDIEGETKITPFNMKEEMEEGHFDKDGFYHFKKDKDLLKDAWLDNIDWVKVKHLKDDAKKYGSDVESDSDDDMGLPRPETQKEKEYAISIYEQIFPFLREGETIAKSLKRLGGKTKRLSSAERWKLKKQGKEVASIASGGGDMDAFLALTELINKIIGTGNMDVYQETYEMINLKIQRSKAASIAAPPEPSMDMFSSDDVTASATATPSGAEVPRKEEGESNGAKEEGESNGAMEEGESNGAKEEGESNGAKEEGESNGAKEEGESNGAKEEGESNGAEEKDTFDAVQWEFRWENQDEAEIHGPCSTQQMLKWKDSDYFKAGVYVRKTTEKSGPWYLSSRIDFELYI